VPWMCLPWGTLLQRRPAQVCRSPPLEQLWVCWSHLVIPSNITRFRLCCRSTASNSGASNRKGAAKSVKKKVTRPNAANRQPLHMPPFPGFHSEDTGYLHVPSSPASEAWRGPAGICCKLAHSSTELNN
jgi:hypothetical protein